MAILIPRVVEPRGDRRRRDDRGDSDVPEGTPRRADWPREYRAVAVAELAGKPGLRLRQGRQAVIFLHETGPSRHYDLHFYGRLAGSSASRIWRVRERDTEREREVGVERQRKEMGYINKSRWAIWGKREKWRKTAAGFTFQDPARGEIS